MVEVCKHASLLWRLRPHSTSDSAKLFVLLDRRLHFPEPHQRETSCMVGKVQLRPFCRSGFWSCYLYHSHLLDVVFDQCQRRTLPILVGSHYCFDHAGRFRRSHSKSSRGRSNFRSCCRNLVLKVLATCLPACLSDPLLWVNSRAVKSVRFHNRLIIHYFRQHSVATDWTSFFPRQIIIMRLIQFTSFLH